MTAPLTLWQVLSQEQINQLFEAINQQNSKILFLIAHDFTEKASALAKLNEKVALLDERRRDLESDKISAQVKEEIKKEIAELDITIDKLRQALGLFSANQVEIQKEKIIPDVSEENLIWFFRQQPMIKDIYINCQDRLTDMPIGQDTEYKQAASHVHSMRKICTALDSIHSAFCLTEKNQTIAENAAKHYFISGSKEEPKPYELLAPEILSLAYGDNPNLHLTLEEQTQLETQFDDTDRLCIDGMENALITIHPNIVNNLYDNLLSNITTDPEKSVNIFFDLANEKFLFKQLNTSKNKDNLILSLQEKIEQHENKEAICQHITHLNQTINHYSEQTNNGEIAQGYLNQLKKVVSPLKKAIEKFSLENNNHALTNESASTKTKQILDNNIDKLNQVDQSFQTLLTTYRTYSENNKTVASDIYTKITDSNSTIPIKARIEHATLSLEEKKQTLTQRSDCDGFVEKSLRCLKLAAYALACSTIVGAAVVYAKNGTLKFWQQPKRRQAVTCAINELRNINQTH